MLGTEVPQLGPGAKPRYGAWGPSPQKLRLFVNERLNFDVLEEKD